MYLTGAPAGWPDLTHFPRCANANDTNVEQFRSMYYNYELNWTQTEALRLSVRVLRQKAYPDLTNGIDVLNATRPVLQKN